MELCLCQIENLNFKWTNLEILAKEHLVVFISLRNDHIRNQSYRRPSLLVDTRGLIEEMLDDVSLMEYPYSSLDGPPHSTRSLVVINIYVIVHDVHHSWPEKKLNPRDLL